MPLDPTPAAASSATSRVASREILLATAALLAVISLQLWASGRLVGGAPLAYSWTKPFWLDEIHTLLVASEPNVLDEFSKLARGGDYNPPALYAVLRAWSVLVGPPDEVNLRLFASLVTVLSLIGLYRLLRHSFSPLISWTATLGLWSTSALFIEHAFSPRFYGPWLAAAVWTCNAVVLVARHPSNRAYRILLAALSALLCTVHYFGILSLVAIVASHLLFYRGQSRSDRRTLVLLTASGPLALACCAPFYFGQRAALSVPTWIEDPSAAKLLAFLVDPFRSYLLPVCALALVAERILRFIRPSAAQGDPRPTSSFRPQAGAVGLLTLPLIIALLSVALSVIARRYAMPALIGVAPVAALLLARARRSLVVAAAVAFVVLGVHHARATYFVRMETVAGALLAREQRRLGSEAPVIFFSRHVGFPAWRYSGLDPARMRIALHELEGEKFSHRFVELEKSETRRMAELYRTPSLIEDDEIRTLPEFYLVDVRSEETLGRIYPGFRPVLLARDGPFRLYRVVRT